jgi:hypothetical protein
MLLSFSPVANKAVANPFAILLNDKSQVTNFSFLFKLSA